MKPILVSTLLAISLAILNASDASAQTEVTGEVVNRAGKVLGSFVGSIEILEFVLDDDGNIVANAELTGSVLNRAGNTTRTIQDEPVTLPLSSIGAMEHEEGICEILSLNLGPLDLDVLGLIVHLDEVNLE